jgi:hypothetical protein
LDASAGGGIRHPLLKLNFKVEIELQQWVTDAPQPESIVFVSSQSTLFHSRASQQSDSETDFVELNSPSDHGGVS